MIRNPSEKKTAVARFIYGQGSNVPDYMIKGSNTYRIITDQLGSVVMVTDAETGAVAQAITGRIWASRGYLTPDEFEASKLDHRSTSGESRIQRMTAASNPGWFGSWLRAKYDLCEQ